MPIDDTAADKLLYLADRHTFRDPGDQVARIALVPGVGKTTGTGQELVRALAARNALAAKLARVAA